MRFELAVCGDPALAQVEAIIEDRRGHVVMRVNHDGVAMNLERALPQCFIGGAQFRRRRGRGRERLGFSLDGGRAKRATALRSSPFGCCA